MESFFIEINILKKNWQLSRSYDPHKINISNHLHHINEDLDVCLKSYDNVLITGVLNSKYWKLFEWLLQYQQS